MSFSQLMLILKLDDPLDAFAVHGGCRAWGTIADGFFDLKKGIFYGNNGEQLGNQCLGVLTILAWTYFWSFILFRGLKYFNLLRITEEEERKGIDFVEHGGKAYHITNSELELA